MSQKPDFTGPHHPLQSRPLWCRHRDLLSVSRPYRYAGSEDLLFRFGDPGISKSLHERRLHHKRILRRTNDHAVEHLSQIDVRKIGRNRGIKRELKDKLWHPHDGFD